MPSSLPCGLPIRFVTWDFVIDYNSTESVISAWSSWCVGEGYLPVLYYSGVLLFPLQTGDMVASPPLAIGLERTATIELFLFPTKKYLSLSSINI